MNPALNKLWAFLRQWGEIRHGMNIDDIKELLLDLFSVIVILLY